MSEITPLTIAYIERRPVSAARVLTNMDPEAATAFIEAIPTRFAASLVAHMSAWAASGIIAKMDLNVAAALLRQIDYENAAALLRLIPAATRRPILENLPTKLRRDFETSLSFPPDTVGASMTTEVISLEVDETVDGALKAIQRFSHSDVDVVFVVDQAHRFRGTVKLAALLRHRPETSLNQIMTDRVAPLSARARLASIRDDEGWLESLWLPVVSRQNLVIGGLSKRALSQQLSRTDFSVATQSHLLTSEIVNPLLASVIGLVDIFLVKGRPSNSRAEKGGVP